MPNGLEAIIEGISASSLLPEGLDKSIVNLGVVFSVLWGLVQTFLGYRLFKAVLLVFGFGTGAAAAGLFAHHAGLEPWVIALAAALAGVLGAVAMVMLYFVGIFLLGGGTGVVLTSLALKAAGFEPAGLPHGLLLIAGGTLGGLLALFAQKAFIIIVTAFAGSGGVVYGIQHFLRPEHSPVTLSRNGQTQEFLWRQNLDSAVREAQNTPWVFLIFCLLGVAGVLVQFLFTARRTAAAKKESADQNPAPPPPRSLAATDNSPRGGMATP